MNPVLILTHNNLELTKRTVKSVRTQDTATVIYSVDNGSHDGTRKWSMQNGLRWESHPTNMGVSFGWNAGLGRILGTDPIYNELQFTHALVLNNDIILPAWFYRELLSYDVPFVTGIAVDNLRSIKEPAQRMPLQPCPDFSAFLIRRDCWENVGPFDERMKLYASDCDFHVRAHRMGIPLYKANVPFYHERSSTLNLASLEERAEIEAQANADREVFRSIYNCLPGTPEYEALFR